MKTQPKCFILKPMLDIASAIAYLADADMTHGSRGKRKDIEIQVRFNTGAKIDAAFPNRAEAITFLRGFA